MSIINQKGNKRQQDSTRKMVFPLILIISLFFLWGMANNLNDILISQFKRAFQLSDFQSGLVQSAFYLGYFFLALPSSVILRKYNYKTGIIIGLILFALGAFLFYPAAQETSYGFFLFALFVIASGLAFLETASNPFVTVLGPSETATFRLNIAQAFNPIGCMTGVLIGKFFIFSGVEHTPETLSQMSSKAVEAYYITEVQAVEIPYLCIGGIVLLFALLFAITRFPKIKEEETRNNILMARGLRDIFRIKRFKRAVIAQFFYMGAQVGIWSFLIRYTKHSVEGATDISASNYLIYSLIALTIGRFVGSYMIKYIQPYKLLSSFAIINVVLTLIAVISPNIVGVWVLVTASFFMSIMYPTIFSFGVANLGQETKLASSILVMAIVGGAILPAIMGKASDLMGSISNSFVIPALCFVVVAFFGLSNKRTDNQ